MVLNGSEKVRFAGAIGHRPNALRRGRPRLASTDRAVLDAAQAMILEEGYGELRLEHVAARAGVGKATIYRRWASKEDLARDVLQDLADRVVLPDLGDSRRDLTALVSQIVEVLTSTAYGPILRALLSEIVLQSDLDDPYQESIERVRRAAVESVIQRGIGRGDLGGHARSDLAVDLLLAPVYMRLLFGGDMDHVFVEGLVDAFHRSFGPALPL